MSKARLVITAVVVEGRSQGEVARACGVSQGWVSRLVARYRAGGGAAFEPRSRRPKTSPRAVPESTAELIIRLRKELAGQGLDAGPHTIAWHLEHHHHLRVSPATISRYLARAGLVAPEPSKRPNSSSIRFAAGLPNECWQAGFTHYRLTDGTGTEILSWLDDHSRSALPVPAWNQATGPLVLAAVRTAVQHYRPPAATLTGNGMVVTTRLPGGTGGRNALRARAPPPGHQAEQRAARPPPDSGQGRAVPADPEELAGRPARPAGRPRRAPGPAGHRHGQLQPPAAAPVPAAPGHPRHRLRRPAPSRPGTRDSDTHDRGGQVADLAIAHRVEDPGEQLAGHGDLGDVLSLVAAAGEDVLLVPRISRVRLFAPPPSFSTWAPSSPPAHAETPGMPGRTISLGMIVTVSLDLPKRRSVRILTSPRVTVSPRNRLPHRARNGHAHGFGGG